MRNFAKLLGSFFLFLVINSVISCTGATPKLNMVVSAESTGLSVQVDRVFVSQTNKDQPINISGQCESNTSLNIAFSNTEKITECIDSRYSIQFQANQLTDGVYSVKVTSVDDSKNELDKGQLNIFVDLTAPILTVDGEDQISLLAKATYLSGTCSENNNNVFIQEINTKTKFESICQNSMWSLSYSVPSKSGVLDFEISHYDSAGNVTIVKKSVKRGQLDQMVILGIGSGGSGKDTFVFNTQGSVLDIPLDEKIYVAWDPISTATYYRVELLSNSANTSSGSTNCPAQKVEASSSKITAVFDRLSCFDDASISYSISVTAVLSSDSEESIIDSKSVFFKLTTDIIRIIEPSPVISPL